MKKGRFNIYSALVVVSSLIASGSCIEPYNPPGSTQTIDNLVVDGFLNYTDSSSLVLLSKAAALGSVEAPSPELNATVQIEDEAGTRNTLTEIGNGSYSIQKMNVNPSLKYRLLIQRNNQENYESEFIALKIAPPIDSITYSASSQREGLNIYVNTHDATGNTQYYQWTYQETWEYNSSHFSAYRVVEGEAVPQDKNINQCWISNPSSEILIASSTQLTSDIIRNFQLMFIPVGSRKLNRKFSLEVQQRALTKEGYEFWSQLRKTTENLGSLFDPLPSQVVGNLKSSDGNDKAVLGYFSGGHVAKKRIFIEFQDLPVDLKKIARIYCPVDTIEVALLKSYHDINLIGPWGYPTITGWLTSGYSGCMDCREDGGVLARPDFWE
jgi:hypothetical protein